MLAELRGLNRIMELIDVGEEPPREIVVRPDVQFGWGGLHEESYTFRLDRIESISASEGRAIYVLA